MKRGENLRKHGLTGTPEHRAWCSMMARCYWSKAGDRNYALYRGAGVSVCDRWHAFENFLADMGTKPSPKHSLDRYPNAAGNYGPGNCRWATAKQQARNWKTRNVLFEHAGEALTLSEWAERLGISRGSLRDRINSGWSLARALTTGPIRNRERMADGSFAPFGN
jgi:hypothetical protein